MSQQLIPLTADIFPETSSRWFRTGALLLILLLLPLLTAGHARAAGGDFVPPFPVADAKAGKQEATASVVDPDGNIIITGYQNLSGDTNDDYYTAKFKADGSGLAWPAKTFDRAGGSDRATAVVVDSNKDIIVTGIVWNGSNRDVQTIKYSGATGDVIWQATFNGGANADDYATCITVDSLNYVYVGGYTNAGGNDDYFVITYNSSTGAGADGKPIWKVTYNGPANNTDKMTAITAGTGGIAVTGYSSNSTDFDYLTLKYDYTGAKLWEKRYSSAGANTDWGQFLKLDPSGNVVVTGYDSNGTNKSIHTIKYAASDGTLIWEKSYSSPDPGQDAEPGGLYVDALGDAYVTGYVGTLTEGNNFYTARYHDPASGTVPDVPWQKTYNSAADNADMATGIIGDSTGNIYVTGYTVAGGNYDFRSVKYKGDSGDLLWQKNYNGASNRNDRPVGIGLSAVTGALANEEIYVAGWSEQAVAADYDYVVVRHEIGALNPPGNLTVGTITKDGGNIYSIPLSWVDNASNEDGFVLERKLGEFGSYAPVIISTPPDVTTLAPDTTNFTDTGLAENKYYYYRIKAYNAANGNSHYSNEVRVLTLLVEPITPVWTYLYNGLFDSDDFATAIAVGPDNHPVVTGYSLDYAPGYSSGSTSTDYYTVKLNKDTKAVIWSDQHEGGFNQEDDATAIMVDSSNNVVVTGNSLQYPGSGENINSLYTLKYNGAAPATILWKGQYNGPAKIDDRATAVASAVDGSKNIVVVGHGKRTATNQDIYVVKYSPTPSVDGFGNAVPLWTAIPYDGGGNDFPSAVACDKDGNIFVAGYTETAAGSGLYRSYTAKYNGTTGVVIWSHSYAGDGDNRVESLAVDNDGNPYVTGYGIVPDNGKDFLTIKYDGKAVPTDQRVIWARTSDGALSGDDEAVAVKVDPIDNNAVVAGTALTAAGDGDFRLIRYNPAGDEVWNITYLRAGKEDHLNAMALDISGNIFAAGHTDADSMSVKYSYDGTLIGATVYNSPANDVDEATAVTVNSLGDAFVAGYSRNASSGANGANDDYLVYKVAGVALQAPSPFTATPNYTQAILAWTDNSAVEDGFHLERKVGACDSANPWIELPVSPLAANADDHTDSGLTIGQEYCYRVRAFRSSGEVTRWIERPALMQTPPAPATLTAVAADTTTVNLSWTDSTTNESGFQIERCEGAGCDFTTLDSGFPKYAAANAVAYPDTSACAGRTYRYRILAYRTNTAGTGNEWQSVYTTLAAPVVTTGTTVPGSPGIAALNESQIRLTWTNTSSDETGYRVYECVSGDCGTLTLVGTTAADATSFTHAGLVPNSTHKYVIKAFKTASCSWESDPTTDLSATTVNTPPVLTATKINSTRIDLSWTETTAAATGFELQKCTSGDCTADGHFTSFPIIGQHLTTSTDAAACQGITYKYRVRAINEGLSFAGTGGVWAKRVAIAISNFQQNFQTKVTITKANYPEMRADYADIRFYDDNAKTELPYWIESSTASSATIWVKTGLYNNVFMYYGNAAPDLTSASNGLGVFDFFDDFNGTSLSSSWAVSTSGSPTLTVAGGIVTLDSPSFSNVTISKGLTPPYRVEARTKVYSTYLGQGLIRIRGMGGVGDTGIFDVGGSRLVAYFNSNTGVQIPADTYVRWRAAHTGGTTNIWSVFREDETQLYSTTYTGSPAGIGPSAGDGGGGNGKVSLDWVLVRKYTATDPAASPGTPENWGTSFSNTWTGAWSSIATRATDSAVVPSGALASRVSEAEIKVTLNYAFTDVTGIKVERCTDSSCSGIAKTLEVGPGAAVVNDNSGLLPDTIYYYLVHSYKTATCGWDTDTPPITPPAARVITSATTTLMAPVINPTATPSITTTCNDLRLAANSDGSSPLSYWLEGCNSTATKAWLKYTTLPAGATNIYMFSANPTAAAPTLLDPYTLFDFYDDFAGTTINGGRWTEVDTGANYITQNNGLNISGGANAWSNVGMYSNAAFNRPFVLEASHYRTGGSYLRVGIKDNNTYFDQWYFPYQAYFVYDGGGNRMMVNEGSADRNADTLKNIASDAWQYVKIEVLPSTGAKYYHGTTGNNLTLFHTSTSSNNASPLRIGLSNYNQVAKLGYTRVRKYANPEPAITAQTDQSGSYLTGGAWAARRQLTITNSTGSALANYQVPLTIDTTSLASDQVAISWTPKTASETQYVVERCTGTCSPFTADDTFTGIAAGSSSYADRTVFPGTRYCYRVKSDRTSAPIWTSPTSGEVCATTLALPAKPVLNITPHETAMDLSWTDTATGENVFVIRRCQGAGCDINAPDQTFTVPANQTTYTDGTVCGDSYTYQVKAVKYGTHGWESPFSDAASGTTVVPAPPILSSATRVSENQINLVWQDKTGDETGFEIERCEGIGCDFSTKTTLFAPTSAGVDATVSYSDIGLTANTLYRYRVRAYKTGNPCGWPSAFSVNVREAMTALLSPTALTETAASTTQATLNWIDTTVAESGFSVQRCSGFGCTDFSDISSIIGANATSYSDGAVCANTVYNYQIKAVNTSTITLSNSGGTCWGSRAPLSIANFVASAPTKAVIAYDSEMKADFSDIRFVDTAANVELPYWIESKTNSSTATVWFKAGANNAVFLYFGNSAASSSSSVSAVFGSSLAGYWPFNEAAGTYTNGSITYDLSGNGKNGVLNNFNSANGIVAGGRYGNGLSLDSVAGNMNVTVSDSTGSVLDITDQITVELWYQYQKSPDWARVISKPTTDGGQPWDTYAIWLDNASDAVATNPQQKVYFGMGSQDSPPTGAWPYLQSGAGPRLTPGQWYHLAGRYDSATGRMSIFVNGVEYGVVTHAAKPKIFTNNASLYIGNRSVWNPTKGVLDEVRVYNRALSDAEIASRYAATLPSVTVGAKSKPGGGCGQNLFAGPYSTTGTLVTPAIGNMLGNSDFETTGSWSYYGTYTSFDTTAFMSGKQGMRIKKTVAKNAGENLTQSLPKLIPGGDYQLTGYMKTSLHNGNAYCRLQDSGGGNPAWDLDTTTGWPEADILFDPAMYAWTKSDSTIPANSDSTSTNGRIPLGTAGMGDVTYVQGPSVIVDDGPTYKMWYGGHDGTKWRVYYATSTDGLAWTKQDNTIPAESDTDSSAGRIPLGTAGKGDSTGVIYPSVLKDGTTYKVWYSGNDGSKWRIYYATSPDGLVWTKYDNTVPSDSDSSSSGGRLPLGTAGKGDSGGVYGPSVIKDGTTYKMWYSGNDGSKWRIYHATSTDGGLTWIKQDNTVPSVSDGISTNGRIPLGNSGRGDNSDLRPAAVIKEGSIYRMWYSTVGATYYATSTDGLTWTKYDNTIPAVSDSSSANGRIPLGNSSRGDVGFVLAPSVIRDGASYRMWYTGADGSGSRRIYHATLTPNGNYNDQQWHAFSLPLTIKESIDGTNLKAVCGLWRGASDSNPDGENIAWFDMIQLTPIPPISLTTTPGGESQVNLTWIDYINDETGYKVERCNLATCADGDFVQVGSDLSANTYSYVDAVPAVDVKYTYRIKAFKNATCSWNAVSNTQSLTPTIQAPTALVATPVNTTRIDLAWNYTSGYETGFIVERCSGASCSGTDFQPLPTRVPPGAKTFSDTTVCNGQTYRYQIKVYKDGLSQGGAGCWSRMKVLTVGNFLPAFPMRYTVTYDSDMKPNFSDLRFFDPVSNVELPYWIESKTDSSTASVWIKTGTSSSIQMYYGNSDAAVASSSNPYRVFDFFDGFEGTAIDTTKWSVVNPDNIISQNNELLFAYGPNWLTNSIYSQSGFTRPFVFEANVFFSSSDSNTAAFGIKANNAAIDRASYVYEFEPYGSPASVRIFEKGNFQGDYGTVPVDTYKYFRIESLMPAGARYYYGDSPAAAVKYYESANYSDSPAKIAFGSGRRNFKIDNVRVRRYVATEPAATSTGTEQVIPCPNVFVGQMTGPASAPSAPATTPAWVKPSGVTATPITDTQINLSWTRNTSDETGFTIQRCTNAGCTDFATRGTTSAGVTVFTDSPLPASTTYCYQVKATKTASCFWDTDYSDQTAQSCVRSLPLQTGNTLTAAPLNSRAIRLSWTDAATDEDGYEVEIQAWNGMWAPIAKVPGSNVTSYDHTQGLEPGQTYFYRVRPYRDLGKSPYSNTAAATTPAYADSPPTCP